MWIGRGMASETGLCGDIVETAENARKQACSKAGLCSPSTVLTRRHLQAARRDFSADLGIVNI